MLSPKFTRAMGIKTFALDQPITLQLACIGSQLMINYGTHMTIKFGYRNVEEYFDIANVKYYNAMLGTPFLRKMGIVLDFSGPGQIKMGDKIVPNKKAIFNDSKNEKSARMSKGPSKTRLDSKQVDPLRAHPSTLPIIMGRGALYQKRRH